MNYSDLPKIDRVVDEAQRCLLALAAIPRPAGGDDSCVIDARSAAGAEVSRLTAISKPALTEAARRAVDGLRDALLRQEFTAAAETRPPSTSFDKVPVVAVSSFTAAAETHPPSTLPGVLHPGRHHGDSAATKTPPHPTPTKSSLFESAVTETLALYSQLVRPSLRKVINATGVVLHTNLGRSPLAPEAARTAIDAAAGYCNLELDLATGKRGSRYSHVVPLLKELTGAEDAIVVNNNAAAVMLVLGTLAKGGEALISRGQLVEIGGSLRIPDVIEASGATLREVGATNKTHLQDYEAALCERTSCVLQVHPSNFTMEGFVEEVPTAELAALAHAHGLPLIYDLGSGCLHPFIDSGIGREPTPSRIIAQGADILTFSGDKLLGGPQAGIIVGKGAYIRRLAANPLLRALRIDKLTLSALEATLALYRDGRAMDIPAVRMIALPQDALKGKATKLAQMVAGLQESPTTAAEPSVAPSLSEVGGGSMPGVKLPTWVVEVTPASCSPDELLRRLRTGDPAVLAYIREGKVCLDVRTLEETDFPVLARLVAQALSDVTASYLAD
ncbi:MAG: L-seryl-tRNA(Sec) selenium transferase [Lachnospiraceae bacterium]|jgi:L-seryl-tRNA(Ser) seleniumtransferase|nr:L-seryl-tRNA(Sec) selenium transferase [Lachnospiraceae bacterium]